MDETHILWVLGGTSADWLALGPTEHRLSWMSNYMSGIFVVGGAVRNFRCWRCCRPLMVSKRERREVCTWRERRGWWMTTPRRLGLGPWADNRTPLVCCAGIDFF